MSKELDIAVQAAHAGGAVCLKYFEQDLDIRYKKAHDLVSNADIEAEEAIVSLIKNAFPGHAFLGEESHKDSLSSENVWCIDPLDGTNNFAHAVPHFAVSVAYYERGVAQAGAVFDPLRKELFTAENGKGAYLNGRAIHVSSAAALNQALAVTGFYYDRGEMMEATLRAIRELFQQEIHGIRRFGAASLDLCYVAAGRFDLYFEYALQPWDFSAGALIVQEAGGTVTTASGVSLPLDRTSILATNTLLHPYALSCIKKHALEHNP